MKILFIGEIVAKPGRNVVTKVLPEVLQNDTIDLVLANAENLAHGRGATEKTLSEMINLGVGYFTGGDHLFWHKGFKEEVEDLPILRPANYPGDVPGQGHTVVDVGRSGKVLLINLMGRTFLNENLDNPFNKADEILDLYKDQELTATIVDFHAEATSEKNALAFYLDGRVDALVGTHTHIPTADTRVLPKGTMYVSDVGMTGNIDSVLGVEKDIIINSFLTGMPQRFEWETEGQSAFRSVLIDTDRSEITRLDKYV